MKERTDNDRGSSPVISGVVVVCIALAVYAALAPTKQSAALPHANVLRSDGSTQDGDSLGASRRAREASSDLPEPEALAAITRRAVRDMLQFHRGFLPSMMAVKDCYQRMLPDDLERRVFCIQLDAAAWAIEKMAPPAWRAKDAEANDYFTEARFRERQLKYALPLSDSDKLIRNKQRFLSVLGDALDTALIEELEKKWPSKPEETPSHMSGTAT